MAAFDPATLDRWRALAIVDRDGTTVGTISEFYLDRETGHPTWALVNTGLFGASQTFVPLVHATEISDGLQVPYEKRHIKDAPRVDPHDELTPAEEATLFAHYGVEYEPSPEEPGTTAPEGPGPVPAEPGAVEASAATVVQGPGPVPAEPASDQVTGDRDASHSDATDGLVPREPGTADPDEATRVDQQGLRAEGLEPEAFGSASQRPEAHAEGDHDLSRTAPVEPGLPGSTAASPYGPAPTTVAKGAHPSEQAVEEAAPAPEAAAWPPDSAGSFEEQVPLDRPKGSSDRWREAKQAAERERIARAASTPPEERSPLERARRRLERLVGVAQEPPDSEDLSPADRDAAERARRSRLGLEEDDDHRR